MQPDFLKTCFFQQPRNTTNVLFDRIVFQSTHPHGVRLLSFFVIVEPTEFQSTHPHGVRPLKKFACTIHRTFQSTHPHGVRRVPNKDGTKLLSFNPRTHTGCDVTWQAILQETREFQSTHPHGVRLFYCCFDVATDMFQSTHPHGVRRWAILV